MQATTSQQQQGQLNIFPHPVHNPYQHRFPTAQPVATYASYPPAGQVYGLTGIPYPTEQQQPSRRSSSKHEKSAVKSKLAKHDTSEDCDADQAPTISQSQLMGTTTSLQQQQRMNFRGHIYHPNQVSGGNP
mmetsp:Transcript_1197/g.1357  ORF Transcript_1197/g.1357 Transcript_1197/m.1357 type:complete len:131 (+) Transcript_1197:412-804(+)